MKIGQILKMGHFFQKNGANFENGAKIKNLKCASYAREIRVNLVQESARHLEMTHARQMRVNTRDLAEAYI